MRYSIFHESAGRLRLKIRYSRMDIGTADVVEYALNSGLILLGAFGAMQSSTTSLLHNTSTILISSASMTDLLDE